MDKHQWKLQNELNNKRHEMLIHGFLMAIQEYVLAFGLIGTAAYILKTSGITKEDLMRCQVESECENEKMLPIIERAFTEEEEQPIKTTFMLNRNQITSLDKLVEGDRFYKYNNRKKTVMAVLKVNSNRLSEIDSIIICPGNAYGSPSPDNYQTIKKPEEYQVVFLRHEIDIA